MNKYLSICIAFAAAVALTGCSGDSSSKRLVGTYAGSEIIPTVTSLTTAQETALAEQLFASAVAGLSNRSNYTHPSTYVYDYSIAYTYSSSVSGSMYLSGTCNATYNTSTSLYTWTLSVNETITSFSFVYNNVTFVINGSNISLTGTFNTTTSLVFESPSTISISGTFYVSGGGISSQAVSVNASVAPTFGTTGTGGTMTGTVGGQTVNQAFTL